MGKIGHSLNTANFCINSRISQAELPPTVVHPWAMPVDSLETNDLRDLEDLIEPAFLGNEIDGEAQALAFCGWKKMTAVFSRKVQIDGMPRAAIASVCAVRARVRQSAASLSRSHTGSQGDSGNRLVRRCSRHAV